MSHSDYNNNNTTYAAPAIPDVGAQRQYTNTQQHDNHLAPTHEHHNNDVHATDYGAHSGSHTPAHGQGAYPPGEPMGAQPFALSGAHHPHGVADPLAPYYPGARRANQKQVTGLGRAMPTYEEMQLKKAAEKRRREGHDAGEHHQSQHLIGAGTAQALDSIQDPNLRVVLAEILGALGGRGGISGAMTPYTMSPPLSRMPTKTGAPVNPLSRVQTVNTVAQAEDILVAIEEDRGPNPVKRAIHYIREPAAEFLGTALILLFGNGVNQQFFLSSNTGVSGLLRGTYLSVSFGWGIGVMTGVYVAGGISGAHLNPAVTLSLAVFRGFSWKKVLPYCFAQFLGAMTGSGIVYLLYNRAISIYEGGPGIRTVLDANSTAGLFTTFPLAYMGVANSFFNEFVDTAILLMVILAIGDSNNTPPPDGMNPLILLFLILGIGASLGSQTAYAINPARDLGPRFMLWMAGYGTDLWTAHHWYWIWCPFVAPLLGGLAGSFLYDLFLYKGLESPLNASWGNKQKNVQADTELAAHDSNEKSVNQHV